MDKYKTIYIDPPWPERGSGKIKRVADRHYKLMSLKEIEALNIASLAHPEGCHLYLWATNNYLMAAGQIMASWGFRYITTITWVKNRIGLGQYFRGMSEHCLFGIRGKTLPYKSINGKRAQGRTMFTADRGEHSRKPEEMRKMIELVSYHPRVELFARVETEDWDATGFGIDGINIEEVLA